MYAYSPLAEQNSRPIDVAGRYTRRYAPIFVLVAASIAYLLNHVFSDRTYTYTQIHMSDAFVSQPPPPRPTNSPPILLVTAFYPISHSKHHAFEYQKWLKSFLGRITTDVYVFVPPDMIETVLEMRGELPIHVNASFPTIFDIPPFIGMEKEFERMHGQDREAELHSPELYAIWAAKPYFVVEALQNLQLSGATLSRHHAEYKYVFWVDAGSMRDEHSWVSWPDMNRLEEIWTDGEQATGTSKDDLLFIPIEHTPPQEFSKWEEAMGPIDPLEDNYNISEGSFFGGSPRAVQWWYRLYFAYFDTYRAKSVFVGKDQTVMNSLFFLYPSRFITVFYRDPEAPANLGPNKPDEGWLGDCGDPWFYYFFWFANREEREGMNAIWHKRWKWDFWNKHECRITRVVGMEFVLKQAYGEEWRAPFSSLPLLDSF